MARAPAPSRQSYTVCSTPQQVSTSHQHIGCGSCFSAHILRCTQCWPLLVSLSTIQCIVQEGIGMMKGDAAKLCCNYRWKQEEICIAVTRAGVQAEDCAPGFAGQRS